MDNQFKFRKAITNLKSGVEFYYIGDAPLTEEKFNQVYWKTGEDEIGTTVSTQTNPHSEITWTKVKEEMTRLQTEYDGVGVVQRKREKEYPSIADQLDEIYHYGIDSWKAKIKVTKDKYPKESS